MEIVSCRDCVFFQPLSEEELKRRAQALAYEEVLPDGGECHCRAPTSHTAVGWPLRPADGWCGQGLPAADPTEQTRPPTPYESAAEVDHYDDRVRFEKEIEQFNRVVATLHFPDNEEEPPPEEPPPSLPEERHAHLHLVPDPQIDREEHVPGSPAVLAAAPEETEAVGESAESPG